MSSKHINILNDNNKTHSHIDSITVGLNPSHAYVTTMICMTECAMCGKEITHYTEPNETHITCARCEKTICGECFDRLHDKSKCPMCELRKVHMKPFRNAITFPLSSSVRVRQVGKNGRFITQQ